MSYQEETNKKLMQSLQEDGDKTNHIKKFKANLEQALLDIEQNLASERRAEADVEKAKQKVERELKIAHETNEEALRHNHDAENCLERKESEASIPTSRLEDEQSAVSKIQDQFKEKWNGRIGRRS